MDGLSASVGQGGEIAIGDELPEEIARGGRVYPRRMKRRLGKLSEKAKQRAQGVIINWYLKLPSEAERINGAQRRAREAEPIRFVREVVEVKADVVPHNHMTVERLKHRIQERA